MIDLKVSVVIPCYNEEESVTEVLEQVQLVELPVEREVIVVDDGSTDDSAKVVSRFNFVKLVRHEENRGKGAAIRTGVEHASGELVVIQDADLEYDPKSIPELIKPLVEGKADIVLGSRFKRKISGMSASHYIGNKALSLVGSILLGAHVTDIMTGHKAFTKNAYGKMALASKGFEVETELVSKFASMGMRILEIPIPYRRRPFGQAKINWKHGLLSFYAMLKYGRTENLHALLVFASCFLYYMIFNFHNNLVGGSLLLTGDEPHYIIVARSIIEDMDLKLENNYINDPIWSGLDRHTVRGVSGYYSAHGIGLPLILAPFYYLGGVFLSQVFLSLLSALLVMYIYKTCLKAISNMRMRLLVSSIFGLASLIVPYSNQIFPEIPMALILILSTYYICLKQVENPRLLLILGALMGYSPFLKTAYVLFIIPFTIYVVGVHRDNRVKQLAAYLIPVTVLGLALMAYQEVAFGNPLRTPQTFEAGNVFNGLFGLIFDRYYGLFTYSPVLALSVFGISHFYRHSKRVFAVASTSFLGLYLASSLWIAWQGGWSYPARLIMPVVPLAALPLAFSVGRYHRRMWFKLLLSLSVTLSLLINFSITWIRGLGLDAAPAKQKIFNELFVWVMKNFDVDISPLLPDFNQSLLNVSWLWVASILALLLVIIDWSRVN